jgi:hypothetical protein
MQYSICPIKWMFLALLDSHEKTGQDGRLNRLILMDNWRARRDYSGYALALRAAAAERRRSARLRRLSNSRPPGS